MTPILEREEYIEQAYFFRTLRERLDERVPTQQILEHLPEEILSITRLPMAIEFLAAELKHTGLLSAGFKKLAHYFTPFQAFIVAATEDERRRFSVDIALLILEREASYRASQVTRAGLFVYQFETLCRNRLGYAEGLACTRDDGYFDAEWREFLDLVRRQIGVVDFGDLIFARSEMYVRDQRRRNPNYEPPVASLFGEKEGKIARANRGRDPLYLFAALQRQLGYPEVPRAQTQETPLELLGQMRDRVKQLEARVKILESEAKGTLDLSEFMNRPELLHPPEDDATGV